MFPVAAVCGNTMVMKPVSERLRETIKKYENEFFQSEQDPGACMMLVELAKEAGIPDGVVNCIHGQHEGKSNRDNLLNTHFFLSI